MKGKVKWFSVDKGYGFVTGEDGKDRYINAQSVLGSDLPQIGSEVEFESFEGKKGLAGRNVKILKQGQGAGRGRVSCTGCGKEIVPRIITGPPVLRGAYGWTPVPKRSICPFCGKTYKTFTNAMDVIGWIVIAVGIMVALALIAG